MRKSSTHSDSIPQNTKRIDWYRSQDGSRAQIPSRKRPIGRDKRAEKKNQGTRV